MRGPGRPLSKVGDPYQPKLDCNVLEPPWNSPIMTDSPIIDPQALERLKEWGGEKLAGQMVRLFLKNTGTRMDQIRAGVADGNLEEAERGAHSLKSSAANIGAELLRTLATRMESAALDASIDSARTLLPELEAAYSEAMMELEVIEKEIAS